MRWCCQAKSSLFGLGIPPAQYRFADRSGDGSMASVLQRAPRKARLRFPAERQLFRLAGFRAPLSRARRRRPARLSGQGELRDAQAKHRPRRRAITSTSPSSSANKPAGVGRPLRAARRAGLDDRRAAQRAVERDHPHRRARRARHLPHGRRAERAARPRVATRLLDAMALRGGRSRDYSARDRSSIYGGFHLYVKSERG